MQKWELCRMLFSYSGSAAATPRVNSDILQANFFAAAGGAETVEFGTQEDYWDYIQTLLGDGWELVSASYAEKEPGGFTRELWFKRPAR